MVETVIPDRAAAKPRVRVAAGRRAVVDRPETAETSRVIAYLNHDRAGIVAARPAYLRQHRDEIRRVWSRASALAMDIVQNSGRLRGAVDQIIADTVGTELLLNPAPDFDGLGYDDGERRDWIALVKRRWKQWAWQPWECDLRGKLTIPQMGDIGLRYWLVYGESTAIVDYMPAAMRARYGIGTGNKVLMVPPHRLVQDTNEVEGLYQGITHDENGRPTHYRFQERNVGIESKRDYPARDAAGRPLVIHAFDPQCAMDVRGISPLAAGIKKYLMAENLDESTAQMAFLQTILAVTLTSPSPSRDAFEAFQALGESGLDKDALGAVVTDFSANFMAHLAKSREGTIAVTQDPIVSHLGPGESLDIKTAGIPGQEYLPFAKWLARDLARLLGTTYGGLTMDHSDATYSSVRMETSSIWPVVLRRRDRIAAPHYQIPYEHWLEEEIAEGRIPFKGGLRAFQANRDRVCWANWQGPAKPTADDLKSANASSARIKNGTTSLANECADLGVDPDETFEQRRIEHQRYIEAGMPSPFQLNQPSAAASASGESGSTPGVTP